MKKHGKRRQWKVVLAEDTDEDALLIQLALERASAVPVRVHRARNGNTALLMIEDLVPDRVLLEYADDLSGRSGSGNLEATAVSAVNPRAFAVRNFLVKAALAVVIVGLLVFAYIRRRVGGSRTIAVRSL